MRNPTLCRVVDCFAVCAYNTYMLNKLQQGSKMQNTNVTFERNENGTYITIAVNKNFTTCGDGYWSEIEADVFVESIGMFIANTEEDGDGDMGINYDESTWDNSVNGLVYTDSAFIAQVREYLIAQGFNTDAVNDITYSEQGMQDNGRVSCDAYMFADSVRAMFVAA